jgi:hypothetical protein
MTSRDAEPDPRWTVRVRNDGGLVFTEVGNRQGVIIPKERCVELETIPGPETECWTPSVADVVSFETGLDSYISTHPVNLALCSTRQYVGIVRSNVRTMEVTFLCEEGPSPPDGWRRWPRVQFDGHDVFIHYWVDSKQYGP